jgi:hypothetical protein
MLTPAGRPQLGPAASSTTPALSPMTLQAMRGTGIQAR